jgi:DNA-binding CsgD family transcriptional regulator/catechol 2,3-dioxygenase-like lactoylglutathione lyase family enzyme
MSEGKRGRPPHDDVLTPAEWRVTELVRHGLTNARIAAMLSVSADAVKFHVANALLKLGLDGKAALKRWDGVSRASALHERKEPMTTTLGPIGQIARTVKDIRAAELFYKEIVGLPHLYTFGNLAFFDCGGVRLFLSEGDGEDGASILYFRTGDIHAGAKDLAARGADITHAPHMIHKHADGTEEWMAFYKDNEGRPLALMAQVTA